MSKNNGIKKIRFKKRFYSFYATAVFLPLVFLSLHAATQSVDAQTAVPAHPRLLCLAGDEKKMVANISRDPAWKKIHQNIIAACELIVAQPPVKQIKIGRRLLDKSRTCLRRVFYLSYAYRITNDAKYLKRAEEEMLAAASFTDWNPTHFLDVGEMTMALSIGYDWLYHKLPESSRLAIKEAILKKGIEPSLDPANNGWLAVKNNWNQVCNAGISYGAIATYEDHPELSRQIINRAIKSIALPMNEYAPDGNYPEGYMYWEYGTSFNVMFLSALQTTFGTDFGLSASPGFMQTSLFLEHLSGTSGKPFNYADCINSTQFNPAVFWFAARSKNESLLWVEKQSLIGGDSLQNRLLPAAMIWGEGINLKKVTAPATNFWIGKGMNPVAMMRTSWTAPDALFVGFKGGSPSNSHGHMDVGSFVMDAGGERWAMDFGMQEYETLESKGLNIWNTDQASDRWKVFRYNNLAHNTLAVNGTFQKVKGKAVITSYSSKPSFMNAVSNLTDVYDSLLKKAVRGVAIIDAAYVLIRDEIETGEDSVTLRWSMVTPTDVKIINDSTAELKRDGKKLFLKTSLPLKAALKTWSTTPTTTYDAPNPGTTIIGFEIKLPPGRKSNLSVMLIPVGKERKKGRKILALADWPTDLSQTNKRDKAFYSGNGSPDELTFTDMNGSKKSTGYHGSDALCIQNF